MKQIDAIMQFQHLSVTVEGTCGRRQRHPGAVAQCNVGLGRIERYDRRIGICLIRGILRNRVGAAAGIAAGKAGVDHAQVFRFGFVDPRRAEPEAVFLLVQFRPDHDQRDNRRGDGRQNDFRDANETAV